MTRILTSPAGEPVEILDDERLAERSGFVTGRYFTQAIAWTDRRAAVVTALWRHGQYESRSGRASMLLAADAGLSQLAIPPLLHTPVMNSLVRRQMQGKRTYSIQLTGVSERWVEQLDAPTGLLDVPGVETATQLHDWVDEQAPPIVDCQPEVVEVVTELEVAHAVATALLTQVVEIISAGRADGHELDLLRLNMVTAGERLAGQVEDSQKLRRKVTLLADELSATKYERDGLRQRLRLAEHNLKTATSGDVQRVIDSEVRKRLDQLMRQAPGAVNGRG